jgi:diadenylate cyclase
MSVLRNSIALFFDRVWAVVKHFDWKSDLPDILFVALLIYGLIRLLRETRAIQLLKGLFWLLVAYGLVSLLNMRASKFLFDQGLESMVILLVVLFQPEIRSAFERVGRTNVSNLRLFPQKNAQAQERKDTLKAIAQISEACRQFSAERTGALIVFERVTMLGEIIKTGTVLQAKVSRELIGNVFFAKAPLHDGAAIVRKGVLEAAGCILPLTQNHDLDSALGTRHRAALGMSEESDALVVVVSEESGQISLASKGELQRDLTPEALKALLKERLLTEESVKHIWNRKGGAQ